MVWFKVDDGLAFHHKVVAAGNAAMGLWVRAGSQSSEQLTDGFIADHMVVAMGTQTQARKLVEVGLWERTDGGYIFHQWNEDGRQPTREQVENDRAAARERMAKRRAGSHNVQANTGGTSGAVRRPRPDPSLISTKDKDLSSADALDVFDLFWELYPKKEAKGAAAKAFKTASKKIDPNSIILGLKAHLPVMAKTERQFIPLAGTWLNAERWADEIQPIESGPRDQWARAIHVGPR